MRDPRTNQGVLTVHEMFSWYRKLSVCIRTCFIMLCIPLLPALMPVRESLAYPSEIPVKVFKTALGALYREEKNHFLYIKFKIILPSNKLIFATYFGILENEYINTISSQVAFPFADLLQIKNLNTMSC